MTAQKAQVTLIAAKTEFPSCSLSKLVFMHCDLEANIAYGNKTFRMPLFKGFPVGVETAPTEATSALYASLNNEYGT
ncbi:MAG: hypothetical protein NWF00_05940 [Candidatus Bathyarchaeota archaeon]|nr:hypothetical protein [Candidatus Bathyarchaeota archaeon]